jgi:Co/Zn/Cd efflux system component
VLAGLILYQGVNRLIHPPPAGGLAILIVALVGIGVNPVRGPNLTRTQERSDRADITAPTTKTARRLTSQMVTRSHRPYGRQASVCGVVSPPTTLPPWMETGPIEERPCVQAGLACRPSPSADDDATNTKKAATRMVANLVAQE